MIQPSSTKFAHTQLLLDEAVERVCQNHRRYPQRFLATGDANGYQLNDNTNWLASFWPGLLWLAYAATGNNDLRVHAESLLPSFHTRLDLQVHITHDLGFLYTLSARAQYQLTGNKAARDLALRAAHTLALRYRPAGRYIQAWGQIGDPHEGGRIITDSLMNIPLLFWAAHETSDQNLRTIACAHAEACLAHLMRPDGSTYHTFFFDQHTGKPDAPKTHQGYADDSLWARGHAWAIYGFAVAAEWCQDERFAGAALQALDRFMVELPTHGVPIWDLRLPSDAPAYLDSSAGAIAAAGALRLARFRGESGDGQSFLAAQRLIDALHATCYVPQGEGDGLLRHGCLHAPKGWAVDNYLIFGDYFFLEALLLLADLAPDFWGPVTRMPIMERVQQDHTLPVG